MIFASLRERLPQDSVFRIPLVFHLSWVLALKLALLLLLWQLAFKPLLAQRQAPVAEQLGLKLPPGHVADAAVAGRAFALHSALSESSSASSPTSSLTTSTLKDAHHD